MTLSPEATDVGREGIGTRKDYHALNARLNLFDDQGRIQFEQDQQAIDAFLKQQIGPRLKKFDSALGRLDWLVTNDYYEAEFIANYERDALEEIHDRAHKFGHTFGSFLGAFKFFTSYALKSFDGTEYLEDFPDRVAATALYLAQGEREFAANLVDEMMSGRYQPATPTFLNAGKKQRGELISCFLLRVEDSMESIGRSINSALQLSKRGGGVALMLTNLRESGAPIKKIENQASGVVPVMKILEDSFSYANQLGARQRAGAVYLHAH
ncbi:MAG: ribonucleotide-diphosphate reductase subunit alpha, partial [Kocuria sp.]|nr:ribonucleotide-diphosphate reductase subunit alpha [Kocuria sp.]